MFTRKSAAILAATLATTAFATQYEAESATVSSEAKIVHASGVSGTGYVSMQEGSITFTGVTAETAGKYTLTIRYKAGDFKANYLKVNGSTAGTIDFEATTGWTDLATAVTLKAGTNTISIEKYWGWIDVDYIDVSAYESVAFKLSDKPVTPNATAEAVKLYSFLKENFGKKTISGIMTGDMSSYSIGADAKTHEDVQIIYNKSGKYPALVGMDFLFASGPKASESWYMEYTEKGISLAKDLWKQGGILHLPGTGRTLSTRRTPSTFRAQPAQTNIRILTSLQHSRAAPPNGILKVQPTRELSTTSTTSPTTS